MGQKVNPHGLRVGIIKDWDNKLQRGTNSIFSTFKRGI